MITKIQALRKALDALELSAVQEASCRDVAERGSPELAARGRAALVKCRRATRQLRAVIESMFAMRGGA